MQRIILLPGFGEDGRIFRNIIPHLSAYHIEIIDYNDFLPRFSFSKLNIKDFSQAIVNQYNITHRDLLIGHSMGGYISNHIKEITGSPNCIHGSFLDNRKIKYAIHNKLFMKHSTLRGFFTSKVFKEFLRLRYHNHPSHRDIEIVFEVLENYGAKNIYKQIKLIFEKDKKTLRKLLKDKNTVLPSLWLHPQSDKIIGSPDHPHIVVPGDHFSIAARPEPVIHHISQWIKEEMQIRAFMECNRVALRKAS